MIRTRGFSLVELLLAVTLLAAGLALAFATLRNATGASERAEAQAQRGERLRAVQSFLRTEIGAAMPVPLAAPEPGEDPVVFEVTSDRLRFVAPMPGYLSRGGPHVLEFRLVPGPGGRRLEFQHALLMPEGPLAPERPPEVLLEGIADARFAVRSIQPDGSPGPWRSDGVRGVFLPRLVRLELAFSDPHLAWPDFVAAPRLGTSPPPGFVGVDQPGRVAVDPGE